VPELTAEVLLLRAIHTDRAFLRAHPECELSGVERLHFARYLHERLAGQPTQYITGHQEFWGLDICVNPSVLIPRPETEHVVERVLALAGESKALVLDGAARAQRLQILECGTGSGCIALALAKELPNARRAAWIVASDVSYGALQTARHNAQRLRLAESIAFLQADLLTAFPDSCFDLVVSNPPYIALSDAPTLAREVRDHEPAAALFAGPDAAAIYHRLIPDAARVLRPGGWAIVELGFNVADAVRELFSAPAWRSPATDRDLAGIERVLYAQRA
jgi:release factor glutamine methyltransferase